MDEGRDPRAELPGWEPPPLPAPGPIEGRWLRLEPLDADLHAADLHRAFAGHERLWDFMGYGPFASAAAYHRWIRESAGGPDPMFFALRDPASGRAGGVAAFLRIAPAAGTIEIGHICLAPEIARTRAATEMVRLMAGRAFALGYRRLEWKCDARNLPSRRAAQRFGFSFEGIHRQAAVVKGRNRDTAWFSILDGEWPAVREALDAWLAPANFDAAGRQRERLSELMLLTRPIPDTGI